MGPIITKRRRLFPEGISLITLEVGRPACEAMPVVVRLAATWRQPDEAAVKSRLLRLSNARASTAGALPGAEDGPPGRPTLKRRQPTPDETPAPDGGIETKPAKDAPTMKKPTDGVKPPQN